MRNNTSSKRKQYDCKDRDLPALAETTSGTPPQQPQPSQKRGLSPWVIVPIWVIALIMAAPIVLFGLQALSCAGFFAATTIPAVTRAREAAVRASCANNLKQVGLICKMFAAEHQGSFPPMSPMPGNLMLDPGAISGEYLTDASILVCPGDDTAVPEQADPYNDHSYWYLAHAVTNETEGLALMREYDRVMSAGGDVNQDFPVAAGEGTNGGDVLLRLKEDPAPGPMQSIPVMFDRPGHHVPDGGNVLYMDGHVEYVEMGAKFPMTQAFITALESLDRYQAEALTPSP
jgi:prepilin-type processing-associated H-X9-DG protein